MLSCLSVNLCPDSRLRLRCSTQYLRISPLHWVFRYPLHHSSYVVIMAIPGLSLGISPLSYITAYTPFTPSNSEQRSPPSYYRGCWHEVCRGFFWCHAAWLGQSSLHCPIFLTAASRRSLDRVSVPMWLSVLSDQLQIVGLVGLYPTNCLIRRGPTS